MIFLTKHGSQCYGLNNEFSDLDLKGIVIPPRDVEYDLFHRFEQSENDSKLHDTYDYLKNPLNPKIESCVFSLRKFIILAANINPNIIELLWIDPSDILVMTSTMEKIIENRDMFLSSKAKFTFSGYAFAQAAKIERHRKWIVMGDVNEPKREDFGLPLETPKQLSEVFGLIKSDVEEWNLSQFPLDNMQRDELKAKIWDLIYNVSQVEVNEGNWPRVYEAGVINRMAERYNLKDEVVVLLQRERQYRKEMDTYKSWLNWKQNRNPERHVLEVKSGYDTKHASHLVRLMRMGYEILTEGKVVVKRPDREEILSIKNGAWSYEKVMGYAEEMQKKLDVVYRTTKLQKSIDYQKVNTFYHGLYQEYFSNNI